MNFIFLFLLFTVASRTCKIRCVVQILYLSKTTLLDCTLPVW